MITADGQWVPDLVDIELTHGDWIWERTSPDPLPAGTTAWIVWETDPTVTWNAVVDGDTVTFRQDKATTTAAIIPGGTVYEMWLSYPNDESPTDPDEYVWRRGRARRTPATN